MHMFTLADGTEITALDQWDGEAPEGSIDSDKTKLSRLSPGDQFADVFDFGDNWAHLSTVAAGRIDLLDQLGVVPTDPLPYFGWGDLPDQYGRRWDNATADHPNRSDRLVCSRIYRRSRRGGGRANADGNHDGLQPVRRTVHVQSYLPVHTRPYADTMKPSAL
jgi:hypothetical protein